MGKYLNMVRQAKETSTRSSEAGERTQTPPAEGVSTGCLITWQIPEGNLQGPATVEFLNTDPDGTEWAFVILPDGRWRAVNMKFVRGGGHD